MSYLILTLLCILMNLHFISLFCSPSPPAFISHERGPFSYSDLTRRRETKEKWRR